VKRVIGNGRVTPVRPKSPPPEPVVEITARHRIEPFQQGGLDLLCGLLSPLNSIRLALYGIAPLSKAGSRKLFEAAAELLHRKRGGPEALYAGIGTRRWHEIARCMAKQASNATIAVEVERPGFAVKPTTDEIFAWIELSIAAGKPVLIRLKKGLNHFTVVAGITPTRLLLFDSCGHRFVKRASCEGPENFYHLPRKALLRIAVSRRG
jgi:hypothetical protein